MSKVVGFRPNHSRFDSEHIHKETIAKLAKLLVQTILTPEEKRVYYERTQYRGRVD